MEETTSTLSISEELFLSLQNCTEFRGLDSIRNTFLETHGDNDIKQVILNGFPVDIIREYAVYKAECSDDNNNQKLRALADTIKNLPTVKRGGIRLV